MKQAVRSFRFTSARPPKQTFTSAIGPSAQGQQPDVCSSLALQAFCLQRIAPDESKGYCGAHELGAAAE